MRFVQKFTILRGLAGATLLGLSVAGFSAGKDETTGDSAPASQLASAAKGILRARCLECHSEPSPLGGLSILDHGQLLESKVVVPGRPEESRLIQRVATSDDRRRMPQDQPALAPEEIESLRRWIVAGAPAFPADVEYPAAAAVAPRAAEAVGSEHVLKTIAAHLATLAPDERKAVRYFSANHLLVQGATRDDLTQQRDALAKAINHLTWSDKLVPVVPIDGETASIFAVDLRKLGWTAPVFRSVKGDPEPFCLYDLVLLEYPYAIANEDSAAYEAILRDHLIPSQAARPIPYVRIDWFCSVATQPPLYNQMLQLPDTVEELERLLEVDVAGNLRTGIARRAGMGVSGVSRNMRVVERHPTKYGFYWKSVDYASNRGRNNLFADPVNLSGAGGEMIFTLPNGLQGYYLANQSGRRVDAAPTEIVTDRFAADKTVRNGLACIRCHDQGMKDFRDDVRAAVEALPAAAGVDRRRVLDLYAPQKEMRALVGGDRERFQKTMRDGLEIALGQEPLIPVSQRFLDSPLGLSKAAGELGFDDAQSLKRVFQMTQFAGVGLMPLGGSGVVRRDTWEDYFDHVVRTLGYGRPIVPVDGVIRRDLRPLESKLDVTLKTTHKTNVLGSGDEVALVVVNGSDKDVHIELVATNVEGRMQVLFPKQILKAGSELRFPEKGGLKADAVRGREEVTLFAAASDFPAGRVLRGDRVTDRFYHPFHAVTEKQGRPRLGADAAGIVKQTLELETR